MEEEMQLPKNIRQIGDKEERIRVYLEDYADTFLKKQDCSTAARAGLLLGQRSVVQGKRCLFIRGAVELEDPCTADGIDFSEALWEKMQAIVQEYFADCSVCGWFICTENEGFLNRESLKQTHLQIFAGGGSLMLLREGQEESFWMEEDNDLTLLKGYYIYYEKNTQMQNYMISRKQPERERIPDQAARRFRSIMTQKEHKTEVDYGKWMKAGAAVAVVLLLIGTIATAVNRETPREPDTVDALAVGASAQRESRGVFEELLSSLEAQSGENSAEEAEAVSTEASGESGIVQEEAKAAEQMQQAAGEAGSTAAEISGEMSSGAAEVSGEQSPGSPEASGGQSAQHLGSGSSEVSAAGTGQNTEQSPSELQGQKETSGIFTDGMHFYKDGLGASVYRVTAPVRTESADSEAAQTADVQSDISGAAEAEQPSRSAVFLPGQRPSEYIVMPGDTLIGISMRFYGSSEMVMELKQANGLEDVNRINIGQKLILP